MTESGIRARLRHAGSIVGLGFRRSIGKATSGSSKRVLLSVSGVAVAIALMVTVSGVALGLASQGAVQSEDVDYWVVPEDGNLNTIAVSTGGPKLGATHQLTAQLQDDSRVQYVTPVLMEVVPVDSGGDRPEYILFVGIIAPESTNTTVAGLPTTALQPGDPYYADGRYDGTWTGDVVVNTATADLLSVSNGDAVRPTGSNATFEVRNVVEGEFQTGIGVAPVALVHLSELQAMSGATEGDAADQLLVSTNAPGVRERLETLYPNTVVVTRTGIAAQQVSSSSLPLAMGIAALLISVLVGVLFTATMMGLEVANDRTTFATLMAIGYSERSLAGLVVVESISLAAVGGIVGVGIGTVGIFATNAIVAEALGVSSLALFRPLLLGYGFCAALLIGALAAPYPIWLSRRSEPKGVMRR